MSANFAAPWIRYVIFALVVAVFPTLAPNAYVINLGQEVAILAIGAAGLNLLLGLSGQISLGQVGFFALAAYCTAILSARLSWPLWLTFPAALVVAGLAGLVMGLVALRARTHFLAMATLAFGLIAAILAQRWISLTGGSMGIAGVPLLNWGQFRAGPTNFFWTIGAALILTQIVSDFTIESRSGRILRSIKESESFAATVGVNAPLWRVGVFVLSAVLAGLSGAFFPHQSGFVSSDAFTLDRSLSLLIVVIVGGLGSRYGHLIGAVFVVLLGEAIAGLYEYANFIFGGLLLAVMLFLPRGIASLTTIVRRRGEGSAEGRLESRSRGRLPSTLAPIADWEPGEPILLLDGVTKRYAGVTAVNDVSMVVKSGTVHALIGPNGAGKSSLINVIAGLTYADRGSIIFAERDVTRASAYRRARLGIARTFQNLQLIGGLSVLENVMLGLPRRDKAVAYFLRWLGGRSFEAEQRNQAFALLEFFGIGRYAALSPDELPYGHRKLVELARALAQQPRLILLDEPIAGLNEEEAVEIVQAVRSLRALGVTAVLVEHDMGFVMSLSDRITVLDYGRKIADGSPEEIRRDQSVINAYLGVPAS